MGTLSVNKTLVRVVVTIQALSITTKPIPTFFIIFMASVLLPGLVGCISMVIPAQANTAVATGTASHMRVLMMLFISVIRSSKPHSGASLPVTSFCPQGGMMGPFGPRASTKMGRRVMVIKNKHKAREIRFFVLLLNFVLNDVSILLIILREEH